MMSPSPKIENWSVSLSLPRVVFVVFGSSSIAVQVLAVIDGIYAPLGGFIGFVVDARQ